MKLKDLAKSGAVTLPKETNIYSVKRNMSDNAENEENIKKVIEEVILENKVIERISNLNIDLSKAIDVEKVAKLIIKSDLYQSYIGEFVDYSGTEKKLAQAIVDNIGWCLE